MLTTISGINHRLNTALSGLYQTISILYPGLRPPDYTLGCEYVAVCAAGEWGTIAGTYMFTKLAKAQPSAIQAIVAFP
jgi:hypothetical protein